MNFANRSFLAFALILNLQGCKKPIRKAQILTKYFSLFFYIYTHMNNIKLIVITSFILLFLDTFYISSVSSIFSTLIKKIQNDKLVFNFVGAFIAYLFLIIGIIYFIIIPKKSYTDAFILGIVIYGVYEGTNYAIFKKWPLQIVIMDTIWGGILFTLTSFFVNKINIL